MKFSKLFYIIPIVTSLSICSIAYADTCYDPNYNRYYYCQGEDFVAPVVAGVLFGAIISGDDGYYGGGGGRNYHGGGRGGHGGGRHH